ncbi:Acetylcholine receptor subunit beta [Holothuria leucospilota]|uniref:Acetylcholine receptor subunit beta n=1 Tax=Holothuria leucospilota TaxID=206669 RepID=A0A9Q1HJT6_HOLLE|nr:Acetylcholine receptor subunit beta [Holothuria leucospilota]
MPSLFIKYRTLLMLVYMLTHHQGFGMKNGRFHSELIEFLMEDYGKPYVRPNSDPVQVGFRFTPVISILDETRMELQLRGMLAMTWNDDRLVWDQEQHGHIKWTYIPLKEDNKPYIWKPELVLNERLPKLLTFLSVFR